MTLQFPPHTDTSAPERSRALLAEQKKKFGFVAAPVARMAGSPSMLAAAVSMLERFEGSSLSPAEREVLAFTVAHHNGCGYCLALHTALASHVAELAAHIDGLRRGARPEDARLGALSDFVREVLAKQGGASDGALEAFRAAGYTEENALDVILGVGAYTLTTFANRLVRAPLDSALERFRAPLAD
jgi:uncharacterized peroxidase-related enzyme